MVLKGFSAANGVTKFLKPKRNIRGEQKTKEHDRKLQAPPQLFDIIVGNSAKSGAINELFVNNGVGGYDEADVEDLPGGSLRTQSIAIADVNNDGFDDVIVGNSARPGQVNQVLINNGNNTFTVSDLPGGTVATTSIATADVDNDGDVDNIFGNSAIQANKLLINNGNNTFTVSDLPGGDLSTSSVAAADVDNDGDVDIIFGNQNQASNQFNQLLINNGNGTFTGESDLPGGGLSTVSIATADVNNDGFDDVIFGNSGGQVNQLLINNGNNTFTASDLGGASFTRSIATADVNNDGFDDVIVGNIQQANQVLINNGNNTFTVLDLPGGDLFTTSIATADVDNDGDIDVIFGNGGRTANQLLLNNGNGTFTNETLPGGDLSTSSIAVIRKAPAPAPASTSEYTLYVYEGIHIL